MFITFDKQKKRNQNNHHKHSPIPSMQVQGLEQNMHAQSNIIQALSEANAAYAPHMRASNQVSGVLAGLSGLWVCLSEGGRHSYGRDPARHG